MAFTYFFALFPNRQVRNRLADAAASFIMERRLPGHSTARANLHLTLHFIGRFREARSDVEAIAVAAGDQIACAPFDVTLDRVYSFPRRRGAAPCVFVPSTTPAVLDAVSQHLRDATAAAAPAMRTALPFRPHVTFLYSQDRIDATDAIAPILWNVASFVLAVDVPGEPHYRVLRRWEFDGT